MEEWQLIKLIKRRYLGDSEVREKWEELQDTRQEKVVRLDVVWLEGNKVKVHKSVLGQP